MILGSACWLLVWILPTSQDAGGAAGTAREAGLPPVPERLGVRPLAPAKKAKESSEGHGSKGVRLPGTPASGEELAKLLSDPLLAAHAEHVAEWIKDNSDALKQAAQDSPLKQLAVSDPVAYNVLTYQLLLATLERGQDRQFVTELLSMRDDPAWKDWVSSYARKLLENISDDETPGKIAQGSDVKDVSYRDVLKDRLGKEEEDLVKAAGEMAGIADEDLQLVRDFAGEARLSDEKKGDIEVEPAKDDQGVRRKLDDKVKEYKRAIDRAIDQARSSQGGAGGEAKVEAPEEDRIPPEVLPTGSELWQLGALPKTTRELQASALAREYARHAVRIAAERARIALGRMIDGASDRSKTAYQILAAHLNAQEALIENDSDAATPLAAQLRQSLGVAASHIVAALKGEQGARALAQIAHDASRAPRGFGQLQRAGIDEKGRTRTDWKAGEHFEGANDRVVKTPLDQRASRFAGNLTSQGDPVTGGGGLTVRLVCKRDKDGKVKCTIELPGVGSVPLSP